MIYFVKPWSQLGECWAFRGAYGKIEIELAYTITISHVTMEHIPQSASLTGKIDSAPKKFALLVNLNVKKPSIFQIHLTKVILIVYGSFKNRDVSEINT